MELIAAIAFAGPLGYFTGTRRKGLVLYLVLFWVIFPIQTYVVFNAETADSGGEWLYWVFNAAFLVLGIGLNLLGSWLRERRATRAQGTTA